MLSLPLPRALSSASRTGHRFGLSINLVNSSHFFLRLDDEGPFGGGGSGASGGDAGRGPATGVDVPPDAQAAAAEGGVTGPAIAASGAATAANETLCAGALGGGAAAFAATGAATAAEIPRPKMSSNNGTGGTPSEPEADRRERDPKCASAFDNADFTDLDEERSSSFSSTSSFSDEELADEELPDGEPLSSLCWQRELDMHYKSGMSGYKSVIRVISQVRRALSRAECAISLDDSRPNL